MTSELLRHCPFCGSQYVRLRPDPEYGNAWTVRCPRCHMVYIPDASGEEQALAAWNQRA